MCRSLLPGVGFSVGNLLRWFRLRDCRNSRVPLFSVKLGVKVLARPLVFIWSGRGGGFGCRLMLGGHLMSLGFAAERSFELVKVGKKVVSLASVSQVTNLRPFGVP